MLKNLIKPFIALSIVGVLSIGLVFLADQFIFPVYTQYNVNVTTPDVTRIHLDEAISLLESKGLRYEIIDRRANAAYPVNYIIDQNPEAGQLVKPNRKVYLKVNIENRPKVKVPSVVNLSLRNARIQLLNYGLEIGNISYRSSRYKNTVLEQSVTVGDEVEKGTAINLVISDGLGVKMVEVPEIIGQTLSEAQRLIITNGLSLGTYKYQPKRGVPINTIIGFEPAGKKSLLEGTEIDLIIAEDPDFSEINESFSITSDSTSNNSPKPGPN